MSIREHSRKSVTLITGISLLFGDFFVPLQLMKRASYIFLIVLMLAACGGWRDGQRLLDRADSLLYGQPDSALRLLDSITEDDQERMSEAQLMRYHLLRADAQNKCFVPFTTDSVMKEVAHYYERKGTPNEQMRAYYLLGRAYYDMGETPMALKYFHEAADCADTTQADCDFKLLSRVHGQMGRIFIVQESPQDAIHELRKSADYALLCRDTLMYLSCYDYTGSAYEQMNELDSAVAITERVIALYYKYGYTERARLSGGSIIDVLVMKKDFKSAKRLIDLCLSVPEFTNESQQLNSGKEIFSYSVGLYYLNIGNNDSALYWFRMLEKQAQDINQQACAYEGLARTYEKIGKKDLAVRYALLAYSYNDSTHRERAAENYQRTHALYNYSRNQQIAENKTRETMEAQKRFELSMAFIGALVLFLLLILYYTLNRRKSETLKRMTLVAKNKELYETSTRLQEELTELDHLLVLRESALRQQIELKNHVISEMADEKDQINQLIEEKEHRISDLQSRLTDLERMSPINIINSKDARINKSKPVRRIHVFLNENGSSLPNDMWEELKAVIDKENPSLAEFLQCSDHELRKEERQLIYLTKCSFQGNEIARLLNVSPQHLSMMKKRLLMYLFKTDIGGATELTRRIKSI